ncbi:flagellar biosynthesis anti-sigma factor FlgM [Granulicella sp. 5B5]|uniref:flagellar biosynthesis anti-sigma factor FlgM n=1 Tax=Granulicella sp. 5B5 TaxID=1617967 RepID=UPI0015F50F51|nr:flagellar biosynthesis anti-sigma factor FlgM [Granulicella sp. 5B5]
MARLKHNGAMDDTAMTNPARLKRLPVEDAPDDVRVQKVERLRAAIASGRYSVSSDALAGKLMEHMRALDDGELSKRG